MIVQRFNLNLIPNQSPVVVHVNQYDTGTGRLIATLYEGNEPYSPSGTAVIQGTKPDGHGFQYTATLDGNVVTADLTEQMSPVAGDVRAQIVVTESSGVTGTFAFIIRVQPSALPSDTDMSESDYPLIEEAIREAQEAVIDSHDNAENSEAWAQGTRGGEAVTPGDPTYHNNSKWYAEHGGGAGGGHTIVNSDGQDMPQRNALQFKGMNVTDDALNDMTIVEGGSGGSTIEVTTSEASLIGEDVTVTDGTNTWTSQFDNTGKAVFSGITSTGTLAISATDGSETAQYILTAPYFGKYAVTLAFWSATINVTTTTTQLNGKTVYAKKNGMVMGSGVFSNGSASLDVHSAGTYEVSCTVSGFAYTKEVVVSQETTYNVTLNTFDATVNISTSSSELYGATISIKRNGSAYGTTSFNNEGTASYIIHETGTYTFSCEYQGQTYSDEVTVTSQTTYTAAINTFNVTITAGASVLEGETLTATNGTNTETATITNGEAKFRLAAGDWEVAGIPMTIAAGQTYTEQIVVFAYHYSETDSNPASGDYPSGYDNYGWTPLSMDLASTGAPTYNSWNPTGANADKLAWFFPKSCMVKYDGTVDYYLDEDDETKKFDGVTASDVANSSYAGNAMIEWGQDGRRIYWKIIADSGNDGWTFIVANAEVLGLKPWNHYDINGKPNMHWYEAKYFGSSDGTRLRSISGGTNYVNNAGTTEISIAEANNQTANKIWTTGVFCDYMFFALASVLITKNLNCQMALGAGQSASGNISAIGQGTMNGKGRFYGKSNGTEGVKVFGVENPYGNIWRRIRGLININGSYRIKMTYDQTDGSTVDGYDTDGSGYINAGSIGTTGTWIYPKHDIIRENCLLPQTDGGSETTYYCDGTYLGASGTFYAIVGGNWNGTGRDGLFAVNLSIAVSAAGTATGAALSLKPLAQ